HINEKFVRLSAMEQNLNAAERIIRRFGGQSALAALLGKGRALSNTGRRQGGCLPNGKRRSCHSVVREVSSWKQKTSSNPSPARFSRQRAASASFSSASAPSPRRSSAASSTPVAAAADL